MIADCETCDRKQVPCFSCEESRRTICYRCHGDVDDPYCEIAPTGLCGECGLVPPDVCDICGKSPSTSPYIQARFYIDHGMIHDRITGKHVVTDGEWPFEDDLPRVLALLNELASGLERAEKYEDALWKIHQREWPAGCKISGARHASEMWDIADKALQDAPLTRSPVTPANRRIAELEAREWSAVTSTDWQQDKAETSPVPRHNGGEK